VPRRGSGSTARRQTHQVECGNGSSPGTQPSGLSAMVEWIHVALLASARLVVAPPSPVGITGGAMARAGVRPTGIPDLSYAAPATGAIGLMARVSLAFKRAILAVRC
jgi:hypothetical protein